MGLVLRLFPVWAVGAGLLAYHWNTVLTPLAGAVVPLLGLVMLGMGVTLEPRDLRRLADRPRLIFLGVFLQFSIMPAAGFVAATLLDLPPETVAGMVLVGAAPGGTASNVIAFLARADVALSVALTTLSTIVAIMLMPALTWGYLGAAVPVPVAAMIETLAFVVLLPLAAGLALRRALLHLGPEVLPRAAAVFPYIAMAAVVAIIALVVASSRATLENFGVVLAAAVVFHNAAGFAAGYGLARLAGADERAARTLSIEVGMQNSGFAAALAMLHFSAAAALPAALFSVWHNVAGSILAGWWGKRDPARPCPARPCPARPCPARPCQARP